MNHQQDGYKATGFKYHIACWVHVQEAVQTRDAPVISHLPVDQSAAMQRSKGAARNRTIIDNAASELALLLGRNCLERRTNLQLSQAELSERTAVSASQLSHIENGSANPTLETLERIAIELHCSVSDLLGG